MTEPVTRPASRPAVRIGLAAGGVIAVAGALAFVAFNAGGDRPLLPGGPRLSIAIVPPVEPDVEPGATMDVGQLSDGFDRAALERQSEVEDETYLPPDAYIGDLRIERMPMPTPVEAIGSPMEAYRAVVDRPTVRDALNDGSRNFGFDAPRRDFAAEREARWAAREAAMPQPAAPSDGAVPYSEAAKYSSE